MNFSKIFKILAGNSELDYHRSILRLTVRIYTGPTLISFDTDSWKVALHQYSCLTYGPKKIPKFTSNSGLTYRPMKIPKFTPKVESNSELFARPTLNCTTTDSTLVGNVINQGSPPHQSPSRVVVRYPHHTPLQWAE